MCILFSFGPSFLIPLQFFSIEGCIKRFTGGTFLFLRGGANQVMPLYRDECNVFNFLKLYIIRRERTNLVSLDIMTIYFIKYRSDILKTVLRL